MVPSDMLKLHIISGLLFLSSLFISCVPAVNPADSFPIASNQAWDIVARGGIKKTFLDTFKVGTDFRVEKCITLVSLESNKFGGAAAFDPKITFLISSC
jgi:hypothetical protein